MNRTKNDRPEPKQYKTIAVRADEYKRLCEDHSAALCNLKKMSIRAEFLQTKQTINEREIKRLENELKDARAELYSLELELLEEPYSDD